MTDYIVYYWAEGGEIHRFDASVCMPVAYLHCGKREAQRIAEDLGARFVNGAPGEPDMDCPDKCEHAANWRKPAGTFYWLDD